MKRKLFLSGIFFLLVMIFGSGELVLMWTSKPEGKEIAYAASFERGTERRSPESPEIHKGLDPQMRRKLREASEPAEVQTRSLGEMMKLDRADLGKPPGTKQFLKPKMGLTDMQVLLSYKGFYKSKIDGKSGPETRKAISEFQRKNNIPVNGKMDAKTENALRAEHDMLMEKFRKVGFEASTLTAATEQYVSFIGLEKITSASQYEKMLDHVERDLKWYNDLPAVYRDDPAPERVLANEITRENGKVVLHSLVIGVDDVLEDWKVTLGAELVREDVAIRRIRGKDASDWWDRRFTERVNANSDEDTTFSRMRASGAETDQVIFDIGKKSVKISRIEIDNLLGGTGESPKLDAFFEERPSSKQLVFYSDPLADRETLVRMVEAIDRRYGDRMKVLLDDNLVIGKKNAKNLPTISGSTDLAAYIPRDGFKVTDYGVLQDIEDYLRQAQIETVRDTGIAEASNIIIITGHKDTSLQNYIMELGGKGCLQGKMVLVFSCYDQGDTGFYSKAIEKSGIRGIKFFRDTINPQAVQEVVVAMCDVLEKTQGSVTDLKHLLKQAVDQALEKNKNGPGFLLDEIKKLQKGITQVSRLKGLYQEYDAVT
jgi:hypothetical protein